MSNEPSHAASFDDNDYARPNQVWQCGWAAEGHACPLGPTGQGVCRSAHECAPYRDADTWVCARIKAKGGPCDEGPLPDGRCCRAIQKCQPVRSLMSRRGVVSFCVFATAIGIALIMVAAPGRSRIISPGPLISAHRQAVDRCEDCHVAGNGQLSDWVRAAFADDAGRQQSALCLKCHTELGDGALQPHGQAPDFLGRLSEANDVRNRGSRSLPVVVAQNTFGNPLDKHAELACATCHREHHGAADLTALTNQQCQICHQSSFHSLANGHPEFVNYPYRRRTQIYFDHQTHFGSHFQAAGASAHACRSCHAPDSAGRYMLTQNYEQACAQCHDQQISDELLPGLVIAAIPAVDVASLRAAGVETGQWPEIYPLHVEARASLAAFQVLLSPRRDELRDAQAKLAGVDLADLSQATPEQRQQAATLVWAYKESLADVLTRGRAGLQADFATELMADFDAAQIKEFVSTIPLEGIAAMQRQWLPDVVEEVAARRAGIALPTSQAENVPPSAPDVAIVTADDLHNSRLLSSGWTLHSPSLSLRYRPTRHADPLMRALLDRSVTARGPAPLLASRSVAAPLGELFDSLASPFASGRCMKCHTAEDNGESGGDINMNWQSHKPPLAQHGFTKFNHAPHLMLQTNEACTLCHHFAADDQVDRPILRGEIATDRLRPATADFKSDFAHMPKANCAQCHTEQSARDRCTTCHNYHVR